MLLAEAVAQTRNGKSWLNHGHMAINKESVVSTHSPRPRPGERRRALRFPFTAEFEALEPKSGAQIHGRVSDLGSAGCYVDTISPFPLGTAIKIRIRKDKECFEADAKVVHSQMHMGMGLAFVHAEPAQIVLFRKWLMELAADQPSPSGWSAGSETGDAGEPTSDPAQGLTELIAVLMRKGILTEEEGKPLLRRLRR